MSVPQTPTIPEIQGRTEPPRRNRYDNRNTSVRMVMANAPPPGNRYLVARADATLLMVVVTVAVVEVGGVLD